MLRLPPRGLVVAHPHPRRAGYKEINKVEKAVEKECGLVRERWQRFLGGWNPMERIPGGGATSALHVRRDTTRRPAALCSKIWFASIPLRARVRRASTTVATHSQVRPRFHKQDANSAESHAGAPHPAKRGRPTFA